MINVEKVKTTVVVPNTLKKSKLVIFGFIVIKMH